MKTFIKIPLLFLITLIFVNSVFADGWHISNHDLHLYEPNQKAVISWDGQTETMTLASAVKSDDIANFAWVIPIQSSVKPEVNAGDISIFEDLVKYFKKEEKPQGVYERTLTQEGIEILESKEIDIYDITILKATVSGILINWLNENGYKVPEEARPILDKYVEKGDFYFVANKIDMSNKFKSIIEDINNGKISVNVNDNLHDVMERSKNYGHYLESVSLNLMCNREVLYNQYYNPTHLEELGISEAEYNTLKNENQLDSNFCEMITGKSNFKDKWGYFLYWSRSHDRLAKVIVLDNPKYVEGYRNNKFGVSCTNEMGVRIRSKCLHTNSDIWNECYVDKIGDSSYHFYDIYADDNFCYTVELDSVGSMNEVKVIQEIINEESIKDARKKYGVVFKFISNKLDPLYDYYWVIRDIKKGMATPLNFQFQPRKPYYPLEISSLNLGKSIIEVYVLTVNPVTDQNDILTVEESKKINSKLKKKLEKHINLANAKYVTRLSYMGDLKELTNDAEFEGEGIMEPPSFPEEDKQGDSGSYEERYNFLQKVWDWISNLFG